MQTLAWYVRRLSSMSPGEVAWRCQSHFRDLCDGLTLARRSRLPGVASFLLPGRSPLPESPSLLGLFNRDLSTFSTSWREFLQQQADAVANGRLTFFNREYVYEGGVIRWNFEPEAGRNTPMRPATRIDYRDHRATGDCKLVWEPNRHQHLPVLARAWRVTGDDRYARAALAHVNGWIDQCPYGYGMNWRSPLEIALRVINWALTLELLQGCQVLASGLAIRIAASSFQHVEEIARKYSRYSSANNHLIGEAAGVFIASTYFANFVNSGCRAEDARRILENEIRRQVAPDGGSREQATGYHLFVLEFFILAALVGDRMGRPFSKEYRNRLENMFEFLAELTACGPLPALGDSDDGFVFDLGGRGERVETLLRIGAAMFRRPEWVRGTVAAGEAAWWLLGVPAEVPPRESRQPAPTIRSRAMDATGLFLLQHGSRQDDSISVLVDAGSHGFGSIAAHGHADALSLVLRVDGRDVLIDPGTFDYFTHPDWRSYFRSTRAHNTIVVDGRDQSEMLGPFLWGRRANTRLVAWEPAPDGGRIAAEHDGYSSLRHAVTHRRTVQLLGQEGELQICDELFADGPHEVTQYWHFAEHCRVQLVSSHELLVLVGDSRLALRLDPQLVPVLFHGSDSPLAGWVSRAYHCKQPAFTVAASCTILSAESLRTTIVRPSSNSIGRNRWSVARRPIGGWPGGVTAQSVAYDSTEEDSGG